MEEQTKPLFEVYKFGIIIPDDVFYKPFLRVDDKTVTCNRHLLDLLGISNFPSEDGIMLSTATYDNSPPFLVVYTHPLSSAKAHQTTSAQWFFQFSIDQKAKDSIVSLIAVVVPNLPNFPFYLTTNENEVFETEKGFAYRLSIAHQQ